MTPNELKNLLDRLEEEAEGVMPLDAWAQALAEGGPTGHEDQTDEGWE